MIIYNSDSDTFSIINNAETTLCKWHALLQEIRLFQRENPTDEALGIDWVGVFNGNVYLPTSLQEILDKYTSYFKDLRLDSYAEVNGKIEINLSASFPNGYNISELIKINQI